MKKIFFFASIPLLFFSCEKDEGPIKEYGCANGVCVYAWNMLGQQVAIPEFVTLEECRDANACVEY